MRLLLQTLATAQNSYIRNERRKTFPSLNQRTKEGGKQLN